MRKKNLKSQKNALIHSWWKHADQVYLLLSGMSETFSHKPLFKHVYSFSLQCVEGKSSVTCHLPAFAYLHKLSSTTGKKK